MSLNKQGDPPKENYIDWKPVVSNQMGLLRWRLENRFENGLENSRLVFPEVGNRKQTESGLLENRYEYGVEKIDSVLFHICFASY